MCSFGFLAATKKLQGILAHGAQSMIFAYGKCKAVAQLWLRSHMQFFKIECAAYGNISAKLHFASQLI